ncbi:MAG: glycosyltransferase [Defluviicoccus sp.]|nr:glycosyltransferase [Defluviicoccus sp.]MDE0276136.1 glycosyltransferase [Defluviicoccus sp.]
MAHIAVAIPSLGIGGAERTVLTVARGLAARGHAVDLVLFIPQLAYPGELPTAARLFVLCGRRKWEERSPDMDVLAQWREARASLMQGAKLAAGLLRDFPGVAPVMLHRRALERALRLHRYVEREKPDILFANLRSSEIAAFHAARIGRSRAFPPVVPVAHGVETPKSRRARRRRIFFRSAAQIVAVSHGVSESISLATDVPKERISIIYNPTDIPAVRRRAEEAPGHPWFGDGGPPVVLGAGRLVPVKEFPTLVEAFRHVLAERPCRLVVLGEGPMRAEIEDRVRGLGLDAHVSLPGWVENPYAFMARAALFVLSSRHEGLGNVLVEALACGCPAVSTDCPGGPAEILRDPDLLAPVGDARALARAMLRALSRKTSEASLRAKASPFGAERAIDRYDDLISRLLAGHETERPA